MGKKTEYTGIFNEGCPGNVGTLHCKCEIYANKPIFKRRQQDQEFVISHETIQTLPPAFREKFSSIPGEDGVFLKEVYNYRPNYLASKKKISENDSLKDNIGRLIYEIISPDVIPIEFLDFLPLSLPNKISDNSGISSISGTPIEKEQSPHHTFVIDGSLFCSDTQSFSEYFKCRLNEDGTLDRESDFRKQYLSAWRYDLFNAPPSVSFNTKETIFSNSTRFRPYQYVNAKESPAVALSRSENSDIVSFFKNGDQYKNINPGIHWSALKRTPLFRGEDFWIEFNIGTKESNIPEHGNAIFSMQDKYNFLDVYTQSVNDKGEVVNGGVVELDEERKVTDKSKELYDFSRQFYFIIEIGVNHPEHNYFLIITEKDYPILVHAGYFVTLIPKKDWFEGLFNDKEKTGNNTKISYYAKMSSQKLSRKISSWKVVTGKTLIEKKDGLRVSVRNHMGSLIVTFSGYEDRPWVIDRYDYEEGDSSFEALTEDKLKIKRIPIIVPESKIAIHSGNRQSSFIFSPMQYYDFGSFIMPNSISLLGPVEIEDIGLLLRDKGVSVEVREYEYSMDAEVFTEIIDGKLTDSYAIDVQPDNVILMGKAPDAQSEKDERRKQSSIKVDNMNYLGTVGSSASFVKQMPVLIEMKPGDYIFKSPDDKNLIWKLENCITPILTHFRLYVPAIGTAYDASSIDVSHHVSHFSDSWNANDFNLIEHSGRIQFLINDGMEFSSETNFSPFISSLVDKTFYIQVSVWWDGGVMPTPVYDNDKILITGLCHGGSISVENNKKIMTCDILDYYKILKDQRFLNSPFFDKMRDFNAVYEILKMAGFRDVSNDDPASLLRTLSETEDSGWFSVIHNGDVITVNDYALPGSYDIIQQPFMRFSDGEVFSDAIERIASLSGKVAYFDRLGVFHFENLPFEQLFFNSEGVDYETPVEDYRAMSKIDFYVSPREVETSDFHRQVFNSYNVKRNVEDVVNEIRVISTTPNGELLLAGHTNFDSLFNHNSPGFIGYPKQFIQMDGVFGSEDAVKYIVKHYTKMFRPPVTLTFEAFGHNKLKALDIITFRQLHSNEKQPLIIQSINSEIDPSKNSWMQSFECQWIFPSVDINWGPTSDQSI